MRLYFLIFNIPCMHPYFQPCLLLFIPSYHFTIGNANLIFIIPVDII